MEEGIDKEKLAPGGEKTPPAQPAQKEAAEKPAPPPTNLPVAPEEKTEPKKEAPAAAPATPVTPTPAPKLTEPIQQSAEAGKDSLQQATDKIIGGISTKTEKIVPEAPKTEPEEVAKKQEPPRPQPSIRTYASDVAETIKRENVSMAGMAIAESKKRLARGVQVMPRSNVKKALFVIIAAVLILSGAGTLFYVYLSKDAQEPPAFVERESLVYTEGTAGLDATGLSRSRLLGAIEIIVDGRRERPGSVIEIIPTKSTIDGSKPLGAQEFMGMLGTKMPSSLLRSLKDEYMFGIHTLKNNEAFLILKTTFFDTAFAAMLDWERNIADDMPFILFSPETSDEPTPQNGDKTATTTDELEEEQGPMPVFFGDIVVDNHDARILVDENGNEYLIYSFPDPQTLVITSNRATLSEIFDRLTTTRFSE